MRISDWSSDVCSSDLVSRSSADWRGGGDAVIGHRYHPCCGPLQDAQELGSDRFGVGSCHPSAFVIPAKAGMIKLGDTQRRLPVEAASGWTRAFVVDEHLRDGGPPRRGLSGFGEQEGRLGPPAGGS